MAIQLETLQPVYVNTLKDCEEAVNDLRTNTSGPIVLTAHAPEDCKAMAISILEMTSDDTDSQFFDAQNYPGLEYEIDRASNGLYTASRKLSTPSYSSTLSVQTVAGDSGSHFDGFVRISPEDTPLLFHHYTLFGSSLVSMARIRADSAEELVNILLQEDHQIAKHNKTTADEEPTFTDALTEQFDALITRESFFEVIAGQIILFPGRGEYSDSSTLFPFMHNFITTSNSRITIISESTE